jgi:hypothetical protein
MMEQDRKYQVQRKVLLLAIILVIYLGVSIFNILSLYNGINLLS